MHLDDDVYAIEEHQLQLVLPITVIANRPALMEYNVIVHPVVTDSNDKEFVIVQRIYCISLNKSLGIYYFYF